MCWKTKKIDKKDTYESGIHDSNLDSKSTNDRPVNMIFIGVMGVILLIVGGSIWMFFEASRYETKYFNLHDEWLKKRDSLYLEIVPTDSVLSNIILAEGNQDLEGGNTKNDSMIMKKDVEKYLIPLSDVLKIRESQKQLLIRQDQLIDDVRQETNNIINKMNGWLGFWMGVMAILGVFVPIALQLKLYRENRDTEERLRQECKDELEHLRNKSIQNEKKNEIVQRTSQAEIKAELLKMEIEIDQRFKRIQNNYQRDMQIVRFTATTRCFYNIIDSPEIRTSELRNQLLEKNWKDIITYFKQFIDYYANQTKDNGNSYLMSVIIVQIASMLTSLRILTPWRKRQFESLATVSNKIIKDLNSVPLDKKDIIYRLNSYQETLSNLHIV